MDFRRIEDFIESYQINSIRNALFLIILSCVLWSFISGLSKWMWHRKKYPPGPMGVPILGNLPFLGSEPHKTLFEWRRKYGDIMGLYLGRRYTVFLNEYSVIKEVLSSPLSLDRASEIFDYIPKFGFAVANREPWVEQRKFSMSTIKDLGVGKLYWEDLVKDEVHSFLDYLLKTEGKPVIISDALQVSISSNIISFLVGQNLDKKKQDDVIELSLTLNNLIFKLASVTNVVLLIPGLRKLVQSLKIGDYDKFARVFQKFSSEVVQKEILRHKKSSSSVEARDFLAVYLEELENLRKSKKSNHSFSEAMLEGNVLSLFTGATDTIFGSLTWLLRIMTKHKDIQEKVYRELKQSLGKDERARWEERHKIPYTFAVLMEAQRFSSLVPLSTTRQAISDIQVKGLTIPKGADIVSNLWAIHNDPNYWEHPDKFIPERFLTENDTKLVKTPPSYYPFSVGRRGCPGERIAWMELISYFSEIIRSFEVSTPDGVEPDFRVNPGLVMNLVPQELCFIARKDL